jgi:hypothetical protein
MVITVIFKSIQGQAVGADTPHLFVPLTGCAGGPSPERVLPALSPIGRELRHNRRPHPT